MNPRPDQASAIVEVLNELALTPDEAEQKKVWGAWTGGGRGWSFSLSPEDTTVQARSKNVRNTPEKACADAVELRDAIVAAGKLAPPRGFIAAESVNDNDLAVVGWVGAVLIVFANDR